ncbi:MAG: AAA family ATPase, partial [Pseudomonadota bacterium]
MINVKQMPITEEEIEEIRLWANGYRNNQDPPLPWAQFGSECGIPSGTLQPFVSGKYAGDNKKLARKMYQFRQAVEAKTKRQQTLPTDPGFFTTETSERLEYVLQVAHYGRMTVAATGPGTGKTVTINDYMGKAQPCYKATMRPSTAKLLPMILEVHKALGIPSNRMPAAMASRMVVERLKGRKALLVIDEANYLQTDSIEELRSWHDECGIGIALFGNEELLTRIETGRHRDQFARLNRRIAAKHIQQVPTQADVRAFCDAWGVEQPDIRQFLIKIALTPDSGGLGECQQLIEAGSMIAAGEDRGLT